ncbi:glycosyltransferase family 2 protein [Patulibacter minatonensis]|uniref:glycosyltransferase family 2 protein n=1 Tax=Patulibacter minatonensis TaxID=298163 RepID=UPI00047EFA9B|nr:glycosyltransferase [Patulibacter minatonensis]
MPRVSVIVPAKDSAATIGRALRSVAAQTYDDWHVVLCDDGSSDHTAEVARKVLGDRITIVRHETAQGPAAARNRAIEDADGDLMAFLDADDELAPEFLTVQVGRYDDELDAGRGDVGLLACDARVVGEGVPNGQTYLAQFHEDPEPMTLERVLRRNCVYVATVVPRPVGEELGWFAPELFGTEDHDFWVRILETGRRAVLSRQLLATYHHSAGSVSSNIASQGVNNQKTYVRALERGNLTPAARRIAKREVRYNRAMEAAAKAWFHRDLMAAVKAAPVLIGVALTRPSHWGDWIRVLRSR